mgnify:CR=1 FL=1
MHHTDLTLAILAGGEGSRMGRAKSMLLVNDPGTWSAIYPPLAHAPWHGWTPTDLIFPFFLFIVGITTELSLFARRERGASDGDLAARGKADSKKLEMMLRHSYFLQKPPKSLDRNAFSLDALAGNRFASVASRHERLAATVACKAATVGPLRLSDGSTANDSAVATRPRGSCPRTCRC